MTFCTVFTIRARLCLLLSLTQEGLQQEGEIGYFRLNNSIGSSHFSCFSSSDIRGRSSRIFRLGGGTLRPHSPRGQFTLFPPSLPSDLYPKAIRRIDCRLGLVVATRRQEGVVWGGRDWEVVFIDQFFFAVKTYF